ncbi:MAG: hypothetical protein H8F28_17855, partial [Fibrella sp.]|nr:hypothetical protein [Armatimonadota bacterium]
METNIIESLSDKTLSELCGWENCARESEWQTYVLQNCLRLMDVPTGEFTTEDIRLMIGQDMGVEYLLPLAIKLLRQDPFAEGMYY